MTFFNYNIQLKKINKETREKKIIGGRGMEKNRNEDRIKITNPNEENFHYIL
jgi:hypothetical protein